MYVCMYVMKCSTHFGFIGYCDACDYEGRKENSVTLTGIVSDQLRINESLHLAAVGFLSCYLCGHLPFV